MDPNTNSFTGTNPVQGGTSVTPPVAPAPNSTQASLQGASQVGGASSLTDPVPQQNASSNMPQMPSMMETLNMAAAAGTSADTTVSVTGSSANMDAGTGGVAGSDSTSFGGTASNSNMPTGQETIGSANTATQDGIIGSFSAPETKAKQAPAAPIARPTNIDGINSFRPSAPVGGAGAPVASNPFVTPTVRQTPNVSFADPADQPIVNTSNTVSSQGVKSSKKNSSKTVLIVLSVIAFLVAAALGVILVMELMGVGPF